MRSKFAALSRLLVCRSRFWISRITTWSCVPHSGAVEATHEKNYKAVVVIDWESCLGRDIKMRFSKLATD